MAKGTQNVMTENTQVADLPKIKEQKIPQKLTVSDLDSGEDTQVTNNYIKYSAPSYDKKFGTVEQFTAVLLKLASDLVQPVSEQVEALLYRATQNSYQAGKVAAFAAGNYLSPELKAKVIEIITSSSPKYATAKGSVVFDAWKAAFSGAESFEGTDFTAEQVSKRKAFADKMLGIAQAALAPAEVEGF